MQKLHSFIGLVGRVRDRARHVSDSRRFRQWHRERQTRRAA
ncbi:hypothetical protein [Elstera cyanobacteriorum]|nr:hypothetical protein [Elstera cyanobacteriorum]